MYCPIIVALIYIIQMKVDETIFMPQARRYNKFNRVSCKSSAFGEICSGCVSKGRFQARAETPTL